MDPWSPEYQRMNNRVTTTAAKLFPYPSQYDYRCFWEEQCLKKWLNDPTQTPDVQARKKITQLQRNLCKKTTNYKELIMQDLRSHYAKEYARFYRNSFPNKPCKPVPASLDDLDFTEKVVLQDWEGGVLYQNMFRENRCFTCRCFSKTS